MDRYVGPSQNNRDKKTYIHTLILNGNLKYLINLIVMFLDYGKQLFRVERTESFNT